MAYLSADAVELLRRLCADVAALRADFDAFRRGEAAGNDAALVAAVYAVVGSKLFTARELCDLADRPGKPEEALRALLGKRGPKGVGHALAAVAGQPCAGTGLVLVRASPVSKSPAIWQVRNPTKGADR